MQDKSTVELRGRLNHLNKTMAKALEHAGDNFDFSKVPDDVLEGSSAQEKLEKFQAMNREAEEIGAELDRRKALADTSDRIQRQAKVEPHPGHSTRGRPDPEDQKARLSPGAAFAADESYKQFAENVRRAGSIASVEVPGLTFQAATFDVAGATLTSYERPPGIVLLGTRALRVADLLAKGQTTAPTVRYVQEDTFTNAATTVAEGALKPEASWDTSEVDSPVRKVAVTSKVTDELFGDFPMIRDYIDNRMRYMVGLTEDDQLLNGSGTAPNLRGLLNVVGIQTQALGADTRPDAVYKALVKVRFTGFFEPDGVVFNPTDWQNIRLLRDANGQYIWGAPSEAGVERIWGMAVVQTPTIAAGTALAGAFQLGAQIWYREGLRVESTNSNEDDFRRNLIAIRAEQREALATYRPKAFCSITGL